MRILCAGGRGFHAELLAGEPFRFRVGHRESGWTTRDGDVHGGKTSLHVGTRTHVGKIRTNNEDASLIRLPILAVADGMGGHEAGEVASAAALEALEEHVFADADGVDSEARLRGAVRAAQRRIVAIVDANPKLRRMGTTLTAVLLADDKMYVAHVGDSRAYLWRERSLQLLTTDHSVVAELVKAGQIDKTDAPKHPQRNVLTRAVSAAAVPEVDIITMDRLPGDTLLLCTDGLTVHVTDEEIAAALDSRTDPQRTADELVQLALARGGSDNVTVVVAQAQPPEVI